MENNVQTQYDFASRPRSLKELAAHYGRSPKTLRRWLRKAKLDLGTKLGYYFTPRQVKMILDHMSAPFLCLAVAAWVFGLGPGDHDGRLAIGETGKAASEFRLPNGVGYFAQARRSGRSCFDFLIQNSCPTPLFAPAIIRYAVNPCTRDIS